MKGTFSTIRLLREWAYAWCPLIMAEPPSLHRVAVVGAGMLGVRIAGELALQGCTVHVYDQGPVTLQKVHSTITEHLQELRHQALLGEEQQLRGSVIVNTLLSGAVSDAEIVIEAVSEDLEVKNLLFKDIASVCSKETILCTNTLSLQLSDVFSDIPHPERSVGLRFLYPVYLISPVEMTFYSCTSDETISRVQSFLESVHKSSFSRMPGEQPRRLTEQEASQIQRQFI